MTTDQKNAAVSIAHNTLLTKGITPILGSYNTYVQDKLTTLSHTFFEPSTLDELAIAEEVAQQNGLIAKLTKFYKQESLAVIVIEIF